jgi:DinB family protein
VAVVDRLEALKRLREGQHAVDDVLRGLSSKELQRAGIGNDAWTAKDLIGHLATWEGLALRSIREFRSNRLPWPERKEGVFSAPATGKISAFNVRMLRKKRAWSLGEVKKEARDTHRDLMAEIEALSDEEWKAKASYPTPNNRRRTLAALLGAILAGDTGAFRHEQSHLGDLSTFVRSRQHSP